MFIRSHYVCDLCGVEEPTPDLGGKPRGWKDVPPHGHGCHACIEYIQSAREEAGRLAAARLRARPRKSATERQAGAS